MENGWKEDLSEAKAKKLITDCMITMFYRDNKASDKVQITVITKASVRMEEPF